MRIDNIEVEYEIDYLNRRIHLMDCGPRFSNELANKISPDFQKEFIKAESLLIDLMDFDWLIYGGNGLVFMYKNYQAIVVFKKEPWLHKPFLERIEIKQK